MSQNQLTPTWLIQNQSMAATFSTQAVRLQFEDNIGIQCKWTGTPTGVLILQVSMDPDNLGWQTITFSPNPDQPAGSPGSNWYEVNQSPAAYVRLNYTATSGDGTFNAKIALKSV